ncbi:amidohydrolase [Streptomyces noursei]|uniref:Amidohydrolase n=1 Tax=Streptomyces noursei TaxID=1971 RepID=A0A401QRT3_STRNR|nr:amidohydrolase [Streptomyces noursei]
MGPSAEWYTAAWAPQTAGDAELKFTVYGRGGHPSTPHTAADPVPVMAEKVIVLQNLVTRTSCNRR